MEMTYRSQLSKLVGNVTMPIAAGNIYVRMIGLTSMHLDINGTAPINCKYTATFIGLSLLPELRNHFTGTADGIPSIDG